MTIALLRPHLLLKMAIEIVSFPMNSMVVFHSYGTAYQRVDYQMICQNGVYHCLPISLTLSLQEILHMV